jgi:chromosome partitioning protein
MSETAVVSRETASRRVVGTRRLREPMPTPPSTRIFTVANQKGGVGKTTTTVNIAAALAMGGLRVLVIDLDPQGNASTALGIDHREGPGVYEVLIDSTPFEQIVQKVQGFPELYAAPATVDLAGAEIEMVPMVAREQRLAKALRPFLQAAEERGERFDYIFIDCPPSLGLLTINAFCAGSELLIPIQCEYYALEGVSQLINTVTLVRENLNPNLDLSTIVLTMYDGRTRLAQDVASTVREHFPEQCLDTAIPRSVRVSEAPSYGQTVMTYDAPSTGAIAYLSAAREIANRAISRPAMGRT